MVDEADAAMVVCGFIYLFFSEKTGIKRKDLGKKASPAWTIHASL